MMRSGITRAMKKHEEVGSEYTWVDTTEFESFKQVGPRDESKKLGSAKTTGSSLAP